ncbi:hypothetical protein NUU61_000186 [Penicillium alfredii]|uniref:Protein kinase domain-containing protein n=1 Tax=Penicillium alfredii TaxID=1506179 RepID=A0A9W9GAC7_9EURO|nr:uncharacterized protein NUU61_000186 [Penicillium alfredii]KAJ5114427.1 hypothetical protein NUU61_000186 [Penicillium alfredii]
MRLFKAQLILWGFYSLLISRISSSPIREEPHSEDLQVIQFDKDDENTLARRNFFLEDSLHEHSIDPRAPPQRPIATCGYQSGDKHASDVRGETLYVLKEHGKAYGEPKELFWSGNTRESVQVMPKAIEDLEKALRLGHSVDVSLSMWAVGKALLAAHKKWIVHRDIKLANILLGQQGTFFLTDWGVATKVTERIQTSRAGQKNYKGPEAKNGEPYDIFKDDVFEYALTYLEADQPRYMLHSGFRAEVYNWLTVPGDKKVKPGRSYEATFNYLGERFGSALSESKRGLIARGICMQDDRWDLPYILGRFKQVNRILEPEDRR